MMKSRVTYERAGSFDHSGMGGAVRQQTFVNHPSGYSGPGNLPALNDRFATEVVIVTELRMFDRFRLSCPFQLIGKMCSVRLISLDDLLIGAAQDYGAVLTFALFRGFADLGAGMTERYLIFLNADFIVSDGSLGHLAKLMSEGRNVIHAPSFRVIREAVLPKLETLVDRLTGVLSLKSRDMVRLALANKHRTVKARTVNQRLCHQSWMDQYYWYVDEETMIGYQWPIALVAIKPQRVVTDPVQVWDYGFIPEAAPTADPYYICDLDDFFMVEPQSAELGDAMIRMGWISFDDIAKNLSMWTTKEQRECGRRLLKIHAADLPLDIDETIEEARAYMAEVYRRLTPTPVSHIDHSYLGPWFHGAKEQIRRSAAGEEPDQNLVLSATVSEDLNAKVQSSGEPITRVLRVLHHKMFGVPPSVGEAHPMWIDLELVVRWVVVWQAAGNKVLLNKLQRVSSDQSLD